MLKQVAKFLGRFLLPSAQQNQSDHQSAHDAPFAHKSVYDYRIISDYRKHRYCDLSRLCDIYGSDKGTLTTAVHPYPWPAHTYTDFYSRLFSHCRPGVRKVFECGVGTNNPTLPSSMGSNGKPGASLRVWRDYFPNATIYGADIDRDVLFEEERITTFYIDQRDPVSICDFWKSVGEVDFDLMIDDGLHAFDAGLVLFQHSIERLADHGIYIIEDVSAADLMRYRDYFDDKCFVVEYVSLYRPSLELGDNSLVVVRKHR